MNKRRLLMGIFNLEHIDPSLIPGAMLTAEYLEKDMGTDRRVDIITEKGASGLSLRLDGNTARITYIQSGVKPSGDFQ